MNHFRSAIGLLIALCGGFGPAAADSSREQGQQTMYFPLREGSRWEYDVEVARSGKPPQKFKATKIIKGAKEVAGKRYARMVTETSEGGVRAPDQLYRQTEEGIFAAVQGAEGKELLALPGLPQDGQSWSGEAKPAITRMSGEVAVGETFAYGTLEFRGCIRVSLSMVIPERSFFGGEKQVPVRLTRWFAPETGMVREVRIVGEEGKSGYLKTDSRLLGFNVGSSSPEGGDPRR